MSLAIAKNCITGKVYNARWVLERAIRDHEMQIDVENVKKASLYLKESLQYIQNAESKDQLRGYEGEAASIYFGVFNELILQQKKEFNFQGRNKRPPQDNVNAFRIIRPSCDKLPERHHRLLTDPVFSVNSSLQSHRSELHNSEESL